LTNGAIAANVFFVVIGGATTLTTVTFNGIILTNDAITAVGSTVNGALMSTAGTITLGTSAFAVSINHLSNICHGGIAVSSTSGLAVSLGSPVMSISTSSRVQYTGSRNVLTLVSTGPDVYSRTSVTSPLAAGGADTSQTYDVANGPTGLGVGSLLVIADNGAATATGTCNWVFTNCATGRVLYVLSLDTHGLHQLHCPGSSSTSVTLDENEIAKLWCASSGTVFCKKGA